jgi:phosphatidate cytidylyltransferase
MRTVTGALYVIIILSGIYFGDIAFLALCSLLGILATFEFSALSNTVIATKEENDAATASPYHSPTAWLDVFSTIALIVAGWDFAQHTVTLLPCAVWLILTILRFIVTLYSHDRHPLLALASSLMSQLYIALPLLVLQFIYKIGAGFVLLMFVLIWLNDTGAFLVGCTFGRHRLFPRISPKKSWEGFFGGMAFCIAASVAAKLIFPDYFFICSMPAMVGFGIVVCAFATWGDLIESLIKRTAGVKDSGKLLPGHGGILDRIDSLLMVSLSTMTYIILLFSFNSLL